MTNSEWQGQWAGQQQPGQQPGQPGPQQAGPQQPGPQQAGPQQPGPWQPAPQQTGQWQPQPGWQGAPRPALAPVVPGQPLAQGAGVLELHLKPVMMSGFLTSPGLTVNGHPVAAKWGLNQYQIPAGQYHVALKVNYLMDYGEAALPVQVVPGRATTVYYAAPNGLFFKGAIGFQPQKNPGMWLVWLALGLVALVFVFMFVMILTVGL